MNKVILENTYNFKVDFFDVDSMNVVWHGNYIKYLENARCAFLDKIGYNYNSMQEEGYAFPVVTLNIKYIKSLIFNENASVKTMLIEYENRLLLKYEIYNSKGELTTKADTTQIACLWPSKETQFICPQTFITKVENAVKQGGLK